MKFPLARHPVQHEHVHDAAQHTDLVQQRSGGGSGFLDQGHVLLRDRIHQADRGIHLLDAGALLVGGGRDTGHHVREALCGAEDVIDRLFRFRDHHRAVGRRAHRIGQSRVVNVYRLVAKGTIEEKILVLKAKKKDLVSSVLSEDAGGSKKLTKADLEDLFKAD